MSPHFYENGVDDMKFRPIVIDDSQQELTEHGTEEFPVSMDRQLVSREDCMQITHWHYEIQISLVIKGVVRFLTPAGEFFIQKGEGIFVNSGVLHEVSPVEKGGGEYICVNFHPSMIYGQPKNMIRRDYVDPILFSKEMQAFPLQDQVWHKKICALLWKLGKVNDAQEYGYELEMKILLCRIWYLVLLNNREKVEVESAITFSEKQRMKTLQNFIHKNYMERITLEDISNSIHVSRGECCRIFKRIQNMSPITYLTKYRIAQSIKLLTCTELTITQIAQQTGFNTSSYYTECFKKEMGITPLKYRKQHHGDFSRPSQTQE